MDYRVSIISSTRDAGIHKKIYGSGTTTLVISNEEMNDIMKIVQTLEDSNILLRGVTKTIKNETREQKGGILSMLLGTLGASLLDDLLPEHPLTNFEMQDYFKNEPRFNGVYSRDNLPKTTKNVINLDEYADVGAHRITL